MHVNDIFSQILVLSILAFIGVIASKAGTISASGKDMLAKLIFNITLPLMLLTNFSKLSLTHKLLFNSLNVIFFSFCVLAFMLLASWLTTCLISMTKRESVIFKVHSMFGNLVYLGFPLINSLFGSEGLLYASMFQFVSNLVMWTVGVLILNQKKDQTFKHNFKHILNVNTIAVLIGFILFLFSLKLPTVLINSLGGLGDSTIYLSMVYLGAMIYYSNFKELFNNKEVYVLTINKLVIVPVLLIIIFALLHTLFPFRIDTLVIYVLVLMASMPAMTNIVVIAGIFEADENLAAMNVFVSTVISIATLPLILLLLRAVLFS